MLRLLSLFFIGLFAAGVVIQVLTYRKERAVRPRRIIIMQGAALMSMVAFSAITHRPPAPGWWVLLLVGGVAAGIAYGRLVNVRRGDAGVSMSYTLPWLVVWGTLMAITQLTAVLAQAVPVIIYSLAIVNLGINMGMNGRVVDTYRRLSSGVATAVLPIGLAIAVFLLTPLLPAVAQETGEVPPEVGAAIVSGGGTVDGVRFTDGDDWVFYEAQGVGPFVRLEYVVAGIPVVWVLPDGYRNELELDRSVVIYWFASESSARAAFDAWSSADYEDPAPWDLGLGFPTLRLDVDAGNSWSDFAVLKGNALVGWKGMIGDQATNPDSPGNLAGAEHLGAILNNIGPVDVGAIRSSWFGRTMESEGTVPPAVSVDDSSSISEPVLPRAAEGQADEPSEPLEPGQAAGATAVASILLAGGSLIQLGERFDVGSIRAGLSGLRTPADPFAGVARSEDGRVFMRMPWDQGGPAWVNEADARHALDMQAQGYSWSDRWGWVRGDEAATRQANVDLGREQWLQQDAGAKAIVGDIMASREDLARRLAAMERAERLEALQLMESQAMIDAWKARVADNRYYWWSGVSIAAETGFAMATGGLSAVKPVGQLALRGGLHMATGYAQAWSENELAGRSWNEQAFARGSALGLVKTALDFGIEGGLKAARAVLPAARGMWSGLRGTADAGEHLGRARELLEEAVYGAERVAVREGLQTGLAATDREAALELLREGRRLRDAGTSLAELEARGEVTRTQARLIRQVWTETFDESAEAGAKEVFAEFEQKYGSGLKEILLGDQGSSATRFAVGSLKTDADRTVLPVFEREFLERVPRRPGETLQQLNQRVTDEVTDMWRNATARHLDSRGFGLDDFDAGAYSGFGRSSTADDCYAADWVMQRQGGGTTMVVRPGDAATYRAAGETIVDQAKLNELLAGAGDEVLNAPRVDTDTAVRFFRTQADAMAKSGDVKTAAKTFARQAWAAGRSDVAELAGTMPDSELQNLAKLLVKNPQEQAELLAAAGHTTDSFLEAVQAESTRLLYAVDSVQ